MSGRALILPASCSLVIVVASAATLLILRHPGVVGCPGAALNSVIDCHAVVTSRDALLFGMPLGLWGLIWLVGGWALAGISRLRTSWPVIWPILGLVGVAYAIGTELRIGHVCAWCTLNQLAIVIGAIWWITRTRRQVADG